MADLLDTAEAGPAAVRGGAVRVVGYVAGVVLSVGSAALLFRHLGVVDAGRYVTVISLIGIAQGLTDVGISALGVRELSTRDEGQRRELMRSLLGLRLVLTTVGVAGAIAFAAIAGYGTDLVAGTLFAGIGLLVQMVQATLAIALMTRLRFGWVAAADLLRQVVTVIGVVTLVAVGAGLVPFLALSIPAALAALALTVPLVRGDAPLRPSLEFGQWRSLLVAALPFVVATALYGIYLRVAVILVSLLASDEQVGYYGAAYRVIEVLVAIPSLAVSAAFPIFARAARDDFDRLVYGVQRTFEASLFVGTGAALGLALGAPFAIEVVAGPDFAPAGAVLRIEAGVLLVAFVTQTFAFALLSLHRHRALLVANIVGLACTGVLTAVLASADGARGAAIAVLIGETALALSMMAGYLRHSQRPTVRFGQVWRVALAAAVAVGAAIGVGGPSVLMAVVGIVVYAGAALVLRAVPPELLELVRRRSR
jgi:O-antigen/teichoic acid export membrane protein